MQLNPKAKRVLVYGDSITWGEIAATGERYPVDKRYTGVLQKELGERYEIIENGLKSRMIKGDNPIVENRNGYEHFVPIYSAHLPLDAYILFLGINDCIKFSNKTPEDIVNELFSYSMHARKSAHRIGVMKREQRIYIAPIIPISEHMSQTDAFVGVEAKVEELVKRLKELCTKNNYHFFNPNDHVTACSDDGIHMDESGHAKLGKELAKVVNEVV